MSGVISITSTEQLEHFAQASQFAVVSFISSTSGNTGEIFGVYEALAATLSNPKIVFLAADHTAHPELATAYAVTTNPTFIVIRNGHTIDRVEGQNTKELQGLIQKLAVQVLAEPSDEEESNWRGTELPRGYSDINDEVEVRGCELLNADEDAGPVKVLFSASKPSGLGSGKPSTPDYVQSGSDDQLLLFIPFQATIKLHTLQITSLPPSDQTDVSRPGVIHIFINKPQNMDFSEADDSEPTQVIELGPEDWNKDGTANVPLRFVKFQKTNTIIVYVQQGDGEAETVRIDRIRLVGEAGAKREMGKLQKPGDLE